MKSVLYWGVGIVALVTVAAYFTERGVEVQSPMAQTGGSSAPGQRQPGDQRVRDAGSTRSQAVGQAGGRRNEAAAAPAGQVGKRRQASGGKNGNPARAASASGRISERGRNPVTAVGKEDIPVFVDGVQKGKIMGQTLLDQADEVAVVSRRGVRQGWAVPDALRIAGVGQSGRATFVTRSGVAATLDWAELTNTEPQFILTYTLGGQLALLQGTGIDIDDRVQRKAKRGSSRRQMPESTGVVNLTDIVKIELATG